MAITIIRRTAVVRGSVHLQSGIVFSARCKEPATFDSRSLGRFKEVVVVQQMPVVISAVKVRTTALRNTDDTGSRLLCLPCVSKQLKVLQL